LSPGASPASALLPARENPHRLFIREPPPSTSASPARGSLTPATPVAGSGGGAATPPATGPASARPLTAERGPHGEEPTPSAKRSAEMWVLGFPHDLWQPFESWRVCCSSLPSVQNCTALPPLT
jgi:hypothetical protein